MTPWLEWQALASLLGWSAESFWQVTPLDLFNTLKGRALLNTGLSTDTLSNLRNILERNTHEL